MSCVIATLVLGLLLSLATYVSSDAPVKTHRTLHTPEKVAELQASEGFKSLALKGDSRPFCAAVGSAPAERWVEKPDEWFWETMPSTTITRCTTVGNDNFRIPKAGCPVHGQQVYGTVLTLDSSGNIGEGIATEFSDGFIKNGPEVNMPFAGLVKSGGRFDYSDCFYNGGHLENGKPGVDYRVHGVMGFPYQAWGNLHIAGINDVALHDEVPAQELAQAIGENGRWTIYEYGVGDEVWFDCRASLTVN